MEEELKARLDEIVEQTQVGVDVERPGRAVIEQMEKIDPHFSISDPKDVALLVQLYNAARGFYLGKQSD